MKLYAGFLICVIIILSGCSIKTSNATIKDCGQDIECYALALQSCSPAQYSVSEGEQFAKLTVIGYEEEYCKTEWMSNEGEMTCNIPKEGLSKVTSEELTAGYTVGEICKGSLADILESQMGPLNTDN